MTPTFEPFTPELFKQQTGLNAHENEAIYVRWVNTQVNYANYQSMNEMTKSLKEIIRLLNENNLSLTKKEETYPFSK
ncbi:MAG TPA: hypothetical protein VI385_07915 [Flavisolibacter sp.]|jgi:hypothetical protein